LFAGLFFPPIFETTNKKIQIYMNMKKTLTMTGVFLALLASSQARAQSIGPSTLDAAGGSAGLSGNTYEWSVGDMAVITTFTSGSLVVTQGTLQPFHIPTGINKITLDQQLKAYPNPANNTVFLDYKLENSGKLEYSVHDIAGKTIMQKTLVVASGNNKESINVAAFANATYMLNVTFKPNEGQAQTVSFKIIKSANN
jgi:hypothetical protein